jgi:hypothetical protein
MKQSESFVSAVAGRHFTKNFRNQLVGSSFLGSASVRREIKQYFILEGNGMVELVPVVLFF